MSISNNTAAAKAAKKLQQRTRLRRFKDSLAHVVISSGGLFVIAAIALIFFYLLSEVWPLFQGAKTGPVQHKAAVPAVLANLDEYNSTGLRLLPSGTVEYFRVQDGKSLGRAQLPLPAGVTVSAVQSAAVGSTVYGLGLSNGQLLLIKPEYDVRFDDQGRRHIQPGLGFPYGSTPLLAATPGRALSVFAVQGDEARLHLMAARDQGLLWTTFTTTSKDESWGEDENPVATWTQQQQQLLAFTAQPRFIQLGQDARWAYVISGKNEIAVWRMQDEAGPSLYQQLHAGSERITAASALLGNVSLLLGDDKGVISQWFMVRDSQADSDVFSLQRIRDFQLGKSAITALTAETRRKGFLAGDAAGDIGYFFTTSQRSLLRQQLADTAISHIAVSPHSTGLLVQDAKGENFLSLRAAHPDVSFSALAQPVWYESYPAPGYTWQSTSGSSDFEGKLSLLPLTFGTLKAAFYAMLFAAPLAICGAMYTATFMAPALRRKVKPTIELMQALPTVILGFLAGLWLAPAIESNLPGIFSLLLVTPAVILLCGYAWTRLPESWRTHLPAGWAPLILLAPLLLAGVLSFALSRPLEMAFFDGDMRYWLSQDLGLRFDQRNALIVGLAMGFAAIAPIFSIAEDALFAVPRHLSNGSLALGATQWQTLMRVVLPTASPGIFSALMIGFGRAVGETMIVLMATGNTAIMDWNIFEGMRTLSANVAVEMGEAEVGSSHFRVLFLSALLLFVLTFVVNTIAEVVRTRLRKKYGSL